jgi:hypothetical protein
VLLELPYARVVQLVRIAQHERHERQRIDLEVASFAAWQTRTAWGDKTKWGEYREMLFGGDEKNTEQAAEKNVSYDEAMQIAARVEAAFSRG